MRANHTDEGVFSNKLVKHIQRTAYGFPRRQRINTNIAGVSFYKGQMVIPPKISGVQKWNFLGKISEELFDEERTI